MTRYRPPNIKEKGGLKVHLEETKDQHKGRGYADFVRYMTSVNEFGNKYKKQDIVNAFGITWRTLYGWLAVWKEENKDET